MPRLYPAIHIAKSAIKTSSPSPLTWSAKGISQARRSMTTATFRYIDPATYVKSKEPFVKPWAKVDGPGQSFQYKGVERKVENIRGKEDELGTDKSGFNIFHAPSKEKTFADDQAVRDGYYAEVEQLLRSKLAGVKKVYIFDHTIRRRNRDSPRQPVQQVHVDQTPAAAEARVRRHLPADEIDGLLSKRYQLINVWRPIENPASDYPLAVIDWRSTKPSDFVEVDLLYPTRDRTTDANGDDDRGREVVPDSKAYLSTDGYEIKGETFSVAPNYEHRLMYVKDMTPDEVMLLKCFDSWGEGLPNGRQGLARCTPHTAFEDPDTPKDAPGRQSIEVRCLIFYE